MISMLQILKTASRELASDIHIMSGSPPLLRINGEMIRLNVEPLTDRRSKELCYSLITDQQKGVFESNKDLDFGFTFEKTNRYRGHLFYTKSSVGGVFRQITADIPNVADIHLPPGILELTKLPFGLVLVTGPTGSGKSTTLASIIDAINADKKCHIVTIEDPIEYIYINKKSVVTQREIKSDTMDFHTFLESVVRMDCDVCLIGEMRDKKTVEAALKLAETGHLTFGTLHTNNAIKTIDRLCGMFSGSERSLIQNQLSSVLQAVISQRLLPTVDGKGRVPAVELLLFPSSIKNLIKEGKINQIYSIMQTQSNIGMITLNQSLFSLYKKGIISEETALLTSYDRAGLQALIEKLPKLKRA